MSLFRNLFLNFGDSRELLYLKEFRPSFFGTDPDRRGEATAVGQKHRQSGWKCLRLLRGRESKRSVSLELFGKSVKISLLTSLSAERLLEAALRLKRITIHWDHSAHRTGLSPFRQKKRLLERASSRKRSSKPIADCLAERPRDSQFTGRRALKIRLIFFASRSLFWQSKKSYSFRSFLNLRIQAEPVWPNG